MPARRKRQQKQITFEYIFKQWIAPLFMITVGAVVAAFALEEFLVPFTILDGGIVGISNIMLITVKERTHEFGIRKALGAKPSSILKLIVVESIVITAFFGYLGMIFGMAADKFLDSTIGAHPMDIGVTQLYIFKNIGVGLDVAMEATLLLIVAGTIAGIIPAWKGARVRPIEALREGK